MSNYKQVGPTLDQMRVAAGGDSKPEQHDGVVKETLKAFGKALVSKKKPIVVKPYSGGGLQHETIKRVK